MPQAEEEEEERERGIVLTSSCNCIVAVSLPQETQLDAGKYCQAVRKFNCENSSQFRQRLTACLKSQSFAKTEHWSQPLRDIEAWLE